MKYFIIVFYNIIIFYNFIMPNKSQTLRLFMIFLIKTFSGIRDVMKVFFNTPLAA